VRQVYSRRDELFPYSVGGSLEDFSHVLLPYLDERVELSVAGRLGEPGSLTLLGLGVSREVLGFSAYPDSLDAARDNDFGNPVLAPESARPLIDGQVNEYGTTRINLFVGQRNLRFLRVSGLDALTGQQDLQLGTDVGLTIGRSVGLFDGSRPSPSDVHARLRLFAGHDPGTSFVFLNGGLEGRRILSDGSSGDGWRDVIGEVDFYGYLRSRKMPGHTVFLRASGSGGWSMDTPFQVTLGGRRAVRGLSEEEFPGSHRLLLTLEDRIHLRWPAPELLDFGVTLFADAGRVWAGEAPFGVDSGWRGTAGVGLRVGFPSGTRGVARFDFAVPLGVTNTHSPIFRITLYEGLGLSGGFEDVQLRRSRRVTVGPDYFTSDRRR
jgi:hypothetical protein